MNKKVIIGLIIILIGAGIWLAIRPVPVEEPPIIEPPEVPERRGAATGWSEKEDEIEAAKEAVSMMLERLGTTPDMAFLYFPTIAYQKEKVVGEVRRLLPGTKLLGGTMPLGVMSDDGYFVDRPQSMVILGVAVPEIIWGVAGASAEDISPREAGRQAVLKAIADAGKEEAQKPDLIILVPTVLLEEEILRGIIDVVGEKVPVFGTHVIDITGAEKQASFANEAIYRTGVSVAAVYTDLKLGYGIEAGFEITEKAGRVTKVDGLRLIEIDNRPAAVVYNEWLGGRLAELIEDPEKATLFSVLINTMPDFLGRKTKDLEGRDYFIPTAALDIFPDLSLLLEIELKEGDEIRLIRGDWEILLNRALVVPRDTIERFNLEKENIIFALSSFCGATWLVIPEAEQPKIPLLLEESLGEEVPFTSVLACGIPIFVPELGRNIHTSLSVGVLIFSK